MVRILRTRWVSGRKTVRSLRTFRLSTPVGCIVTYGDVFDAQREYAVRYNQAIVQYLRSQPKRTANPG